MLTNFPNGVSSYGVPLLGSGIPMTFGTYYFVDADNGSDANDGLSKETALKTVAAAYAKTVTNHDDVIVLSSNAGHTISSMLTVSKNRVHFVGAGAPGRKYGQRARLSMGTTTAVTDVGMIKVTGIGCSFTNIKFSSTNALTQSIYTVIEGGEYTIYQNCEFYKGSHLNVTTASELVANGDSTQYINCTFGSLADAVSGNIIRSAVRLTKEIAGTGKVARDNYFENCLFWKRAGGTTTAFVYSAADADVERLVHFIGLVSDGGVHSHINHLKGLLTAAQEFGLTENVLS